MNLLAPAATIANPVSHLPRSRFYETPGEDLFGKVWNFLFHNEGTAYVAILLASAVPMPLWILFGAAGAYVALFRRPGAVVPALLLLFWIGYTLALNGPVVSPKYRLPLEPAWVVFTAIGLSALWQRIAARKRRFQD